MNNCCRCFPDDQEFHLCAPCEQILQNRITVVLDEEFPQDQGYDSNWLAEPLLRYFECALCLGVFREPVQIRECGHVFCMGCLDRATREKKMCPNDREIFTETFPDQAKRRDVLSLDVACKNEGCTWQGELSDLLEHLRRNCLKIRFACLNEGCEEVLCRENLFAHINDECQFRLIACEFCALSITFLQIKEHHSVNCQRIPTSCEFVSGRRFPRNEACLMAGNEIQIGKAELVEVKANNSEYKFENVEGLKIPSKYVVSIRNSKSVKSDKFEYDACELYTTEVNPAIENLIKDGDNKNGDNKKLNESAHTSLEMIKDFQRSGVHLSKGKPENPKKTWVLFCVGHPSEHTEILADQSSTIKSIKDKKSKIGIAYQVGDNHAEIAMMEKLEVDDIKGGENKLEIYMYINNSPCHICVPRIVSFAKKFHLKFNITFASLYKCQRDSCETRFNGKCCLGPEPENMKCLFVLNENVDFTLQTFNSGTWHFFRCLTCRYVTQGESNEVILKFENLFKSYIAFHIKEEFLYRDDEDTYMKTDFEIILEDCLNEANLNSNITIDQEEKPIASASDTPMPDGISDLFKYN